ncbi:MAG: PhzF family phenazine biosynthesis isomerase [Dehalococcoidia bacterium]|nr:PhzF family phenazine biosynthesis isomerase [Dehalococcoidia bacterium]
MEQTIIQVDAFTDRPFTGNPAAVVLLDSRRDGRWMQAVAREMNLSETAFVHRRGDYFDLRWFTPTVEVQLCGHATLAAAHVLWETGGLEPDKIAQFTTHSGVLTARRDGDWIELDFPATPESPMAAPLELTQALGVTPIYSGKSAYDYLIEVESEEAVRALKPDFGLLAKVQARGVMVTAPSSRPQYDFVSRFFAPALGIDEDPVTGSAHCCLGPYWRKKLGKTEFLAYQASKRGGTVRVKLNGDRVLLGGQAVTVMRGELAGSD